MKEMKKVINNVKYEDGSLLEAMHAVQQVEGYLTKEAVFELSDAFGILPIQVYETATFYSMIRFAPVGTNLIQICRNAPCHVVGAEQTVKAFEDILGIKMGQTTSDNKYTLEYVECIGQCQASPNILINGEIHHNVTSNKVQDSINNLG